MNIPKGLTSSTLKNSRQIIKIKNLSIGIILTYLILAVGSILLYNFNFFFLIITGYCAFAIIKHIIDSLIEVQLSEQYMSINKKRIAFKNIKSINTKSSTKTFKADHHHSYTSTSKEVVITFKNGKRTRLFKGLTKHQREYILHQINGRRKKVANNL